MGRFTTQSVSFSWGGEVLAKELQPPREELAFIRIIQSTSALARVHLIWVVDGKRLVGELGHGADLTVAGVEYLVLSVGGRV